MKKTPIKILETKISGVSPYQPLEYLEITKNMVGWRIKFIWPKPKPKKWFEFWS